MHQPLYLIASSGWGDQRSDVTVHLPQRDTSPGAMTRRARAYLIITAARHLSIGAFTIAAQGQFTAAAFIPIVGYLPLVVWGIAFLIAAVVCLMGAWLRSAAWARAGLLLSAVTTALIATGLWIGIITIWRNGGQATPISVILLTALVCKDLAVCTQPLRSPFESILYRFVSERR